MSNQLRTDSATTPDRENNPDPVLTYLQLYADLTYNVLICCRPECRHAISPDGAQVTAHLWNKHSVPLADRLGLPEHIRDYYSSVFQNPSDAALRPCGSKPHPEVQTYDGFSCRNSALQPTYSTPTPWKSTQPYKRALY
ncbi:uncharacterized protein B0I36DRAFT_161639 [Microdochium trichocladiopsis]|uniref:Uncharacterized protein n=1 Tax=Microdochium trichocladiopsis TaxID=1682393 RepID=A0A9P8XWV9_9PEZI|nr:uncharacterized protein B0I36DRAFT_161639 [Microdochium trichocladiopsis]KAH7024318.1 hypothetical protein B0I36DRAFT_161639 [Microdochium trichocladiopsis]